MNSLFSLHCGCYNLADRSSKQKAAEDGRGQCRGGWTRAELHYGRGN